MDDIDNDYNPDEFTSNGGWPEFADPGGRSALRAGARIHPCPTCGRENQLTAEDVARHYQCDHCADAAEGYFPNGEY
jgi:hypothetical protein